MYLSHPRWPAILIHAPDTFPIAFQILFLLDGGIVSERWDNGVAKHFQKGGGQGRESFQGGAQAAMNGMPSFPDTVDAHGAVELVEFDVRYLEESIAANTWEFG
jgi:hypothetical protein